MDLRKQAIDIFLSGVDSVLPERLITQFIKLNSNLLTCKGEVYDLRNFEHIYLTGFGKASSAMGKALEKLLDKRITGGHILTKYGHGTHLDHVVVSEAGHPVPDLNGLKATSDIVRIIRQASSRDLLIVLISGGGSSLMTDLPESIQLEDLTVTNRLLIHCGASIGEINTVRKHLSCLKGGQLARLAYPATVLSLLISDVVGDPPDVIASGPTVADHSTFAGAWKVLERYKLVTAVPESVRNYLMQGVNGFHPETVREGDPMLHKTKTVVLGNNSTALAACAAKSAGMGYNPVIISGSVTGDVGEVADYIYANLQRHLNGPAQGKTALLFGGEPTVQLSGKGKGGRNQHLTLLIARKIAGMKGVVFLSAGTDGTDGPTDAAGAVCDGETAKHSAKSGLNMEKATLNFDSYSFFESEGGILKTGPTFTNVMDLMIVLTDR